MTTRRNRPTDITDAPEHRSIPLDRVEMRDDSANDNEIVLEGYASTFEEYEMYGGPSNFGWIERIDPKAFDVTLREKPDLHLLINHAGMPLARTKSGNLDLKADDKGLKVTARLDKRDPEVQSLAVKMERGDMDEMSFAFRVKGQEWRAADGYEDIDDESYRTITEVSLHKGDVSVVNWGANPTTSAGVRSAVDALKVLAECDESELAEIRSDDVLMRAVEKLTGKATVNIETLNVIERNSDEEGAEERADSDDDPSALIAGIDAAVDQAITLTADVDREGLSAEVAQALDLLVGIDTMVDELMELTGTYDPDEATSLDLQDVSFASEIAGTGTDALMEAFALLTERLEALDEAVRDAEAVADESAEEGPEPGARLVEALAAQGILPERLSLAAALAAQVA